jgi:GTP-binding protein HflX
VSALEGEGLDKLLARVDDALPSPPVEVHLRIPYARHDVTARLHREAEVLRVEEGERGSDVWARVREDQWSWVREFARDETAPS